MSKKDRPEFGRRLDAAVAAAFPGVECQTYFNIIPMRYVSHWAVAGTDMEQKLTPHKARRVRDFVAGFSAAEESRHD